VNVNHYIIAKMFEKEMNNPLEKRNGKTNYQKKITSI
jgi:hypothetical protein